MPSNVVSSRLAQSYSSSPNIVLFPTPSLVTCISTLASLCLPRSANIKAPSDDGFCSAQHFVRLSQAFALFLFLVVFIILIRAVSSGSLLATTVGLLLRPLARSAFDARCHRTATIESKCRVWNHDGMIRILVGGENRNVVVNHEPPHRSFAAYAAREFHKVLLPTAP